MRTYKVSCGPHYDADATMAVPELTRNSFYILFHGRSQGQIFSKANNLIASPVRYVFQCSLWRPNILPYLI